MTIDSDSVPRREVALANVEGFGPIPLVDHPDQGQRPRAVYGEDHNHRVTVFAWGAQLDFNIGGVGAATVNVQTHQLRSLAVAIYQALKANGGLPE